MAHMKCSLAPELPPRIGVHPVNEPLKLAGNVVDPMDRSFLILKAVLPE
jgi:hypothetical protein